MLDRLGKTAGSAGKPAPKAEKNLFGYTVIQLMLWVNLTAFPISTKETRPVSSLRRSPGYKSRHTSSADRKL